MTTAEIVLIACELEREADFREMARVKNLDGEIRESYARRASDLREMARKMKQGEALV